MNQRPQGLKVEKAMAGFLQYKSAEASHPNSLLVFLFTIIFRNEHIVGHKSQRLDLLADAGGTLTFLPRVVV